MRAAEGADAPVGLVFDGEGRARVYVAGLQGRTLLARRFEAILGELSGVHRVQASSSTGRILVLYGAPLDATALLARVRQTRELLMPAPTVPMPTPAAIASGALALLGIGGVLSAALFKGTAAVLMGAASASPRSRPAAAAPTKPVPGTGTETRRGIALRGPDPRLLALLHPYRRELAGAALASCVAAAAGVLRIVAIGLAIDVLLGGAAFAPALGLAAPSAGALLLGSLLLTLLQQSIRHYGRKRWSSAARAIQHELRLRVFDSIQRMSLDSFHEQRRGELLAVLTADIDNLEKTADAGWGLMDLSISSTVLLSAIGLQVRRSALWALAPVPVLVGLSLYLYPKLRGTFGHLRTASAQLSARASNQLEGIDVIKSFNAEDRELERLSESSQNYRAQSVTAAHMQSAVPLLLETTILSALILTYRANTLLTVGSGMAFGKFQTVNMLTGHFVFPLMALGAHVDTFGDGMASLERVFAVLEHDDEAAADTQLAPVPEAALSGAIEYRDVGFAYPSGAPVLHGVSLSIAAGSTTAIVGLSGSGKSTLLKLLLRLYGEHSGTITIGGHELRHIPRHQLRAAIAVVSQEVYLFDRSVTENIRIARPDASFDEVVAAARMAEADGFISRLPEGYDTRIGERGTALSAGQRQCLSIARAILKNAPIIVLDEATSSLDSNTEACIARAFRHNPKPQTVIVIAHRLATVRHADCIYTLEGGRVTASGRHDELIGQPGRYRSLWQDQTGVLTMLKSA